MNEEGKTYQVGNLIYFKPDDLWFDDIQEARKYAMDREDDDAPYGIWNRASELIEIIYEGESWINR